MFGWLKRFYIALPCLLLVLSVWAHRALADDASNPATKSERKDVSSEKPESLLYDKATNPGINMLDRALAMRLTAEKLSDLGMVVNYCQQALDLGLDPFHADLAKTLLATTLTQRAQFTAKAAFRPDQDRANWLALRKLALRDLEKALQYKPDYPEALLLFAELHVPLGGDRKAAVQALDKVLALEDLNPEEYQQAIVLRANLEEDLAAKRAFLDKALVADPDNLDILRLRGLTLMALGKLEGAKADFRKALKIDPSNAATCEALATVLVDLGENEAAEQVVQKLLELSPGDITPLTIHAQLNVQKKDLPAALDDLNHALELEPNNTNVLLMRAFLYHEMKLPDQALADVEKVLEIRPRFDRARRFRIALFAEKGDVDKTLEEVEKLQKEQPDDPELLLQLAILYAMKKDSSESIKYYDRLLDKDQKNLDALEGRASVYLGMGKHAEAIADFNRAYKLAPDCSEILNNLAWVLATSPQDQLRNGKRAVKLATKACELTEYQKPHVLSTLAAAYAETGDFTHAIEYSTKAVELSKTLDDRQMHEALQKELKSYQEKTPWRELLEDGLPAPEK